MKLSLTMFMSIVLLACQLARAQQPTGPRPLEVQVRTSEIVAVTDPLTVAIEIRNTTTDKTFNVQAIVVELPEPFVIGKRADKQDLVTPSQPGRDLNPGNSLFRSFAIQRASFFEAPGKCLVFRCSNHQLVVRVSYYSGIPQNSGEIVEFINLRPRAPLLAVIAGGVVGVLLATIFSLARQPAGAPAKSAQGAVSSPWWRSVFGTALAAFRTILYGAIATATAVLLVSATTVADFPVSISVCDSLGGLVLGLFFKPVGEFVQSKISA